MRLTWGRLAKRVGGVYERGRMKHEPGIFENPDPAAEAAADERADADIAAGRHYPNDAVVAWLRTWGKPDFKPFPRQWRK